MLVIASPARSQPSPPPVDQAAQHLEMNSVGEGPGKRPGKRRASGVRRLQSNVSSLVLPSNLWKPPPLASASASALLPNSQPLTPSLHNHALVMLINAGRVDIFRFTRQGAIDLIRRGAFDSAVIPRPTRPSSSGDWSSFLGASIVKTNQMLYI